MPRGKKPLYASKPSMKKSATRSTRASSRVAKASQVGKNLSTVPAVPTLKDVVATVEGGPPSAPKEPEEGILYSKLDYIQKNLKNSFTSLAMQDLHLLFFHAFFWCALYYLCI
jgi:hypothetical protein